MKAFPGADPDSDHNLVVTDLQLRLKRVRGGKTREKFDLEKLKEGGKDDKLVNTFMFKWNREANDESTNEKWKRMKQNLWESAELSWEQFCERANLHV